MKFGAFQNLKDKLLPKGDGKLESLPLSAYGKLTLYKDYINLQVNDGPAAAFKKWMDQAFGMTFEEFGGRAVTLDYPSRIVWHLPAAKAYAVGVIWPSTDEGGLRKFPFCFFTVISKGTLAGRPIAEGLALLVPIWKFAERAYEEARALSNIEAFYTAFGDRKIETEPEAQDSADGISREEWMTGMMPADGAGFSHRLTANVSNLIGGARTLAEQGAALAVRLPLSRALPVAPQVCIWERAFRDNLKNCDLWPSMILPSDPMAEEPTLTLIWREPIKEDARLFASDVSGYDHIEDIAGESRVAGDMASELTEVAPDIDGWIAQVGR